jgi:dTDP-glucose 4,6-dehydratase
MQLKQTVIFVTGGGGFIGSAVIRHLLEETQACVVNIDKLTYASSVGTIPQAPKAGQRYHFAQVDICNQLALRRLFEKFQPQLVMNLAAETHVDRSIDHPEQFVQTNVVGTFTLLQEALHFWRTLSADARSCFRFHHISTDEVYGSLTGEGRFTENTAYSPNSPYAATKAGSDHLVRAWCKTYDLPTLITNCANNYGPYQFPEKLIPHMIIRSLAGEPLPIYGDGQNVRDWLYVEDHVRALMLVLKHGSIGATYNIGGRNERTTIEVVSALCALLDEMRPSAKGPHELLINYVADRPAHDHRYAIDPSKMERELGWRPVHTFEEGLRSTVRWYLDHQDWWQAIMRRGYKAERLGLVQRAQWGI